MVEGAFELSQSPWRYTCNKAPMRPAHKETGEWGGARKSGSPLISKETMVCVCVCVCACVGGSPLISKETLVCMCVCVCFKAKSSGNMKNYGNKKQNREQ